MTTYVTLKADIAAWLNRDDLTAYIPSFIRLAEAAIRRDVRCRAMETTASLAITAGTAPVPDGFIEARRLILDSATSWALDYMPPDVLYSTVAYNEAGSAVFYTIEGDNLVFRPSTTETGLLLYVKAFTALSANTDTNWLLTNAYDAYLYGALVHSAPFLKEDARTGIWVEGYKSAVSGVNKQENRARSGQGLRVIGTFGP